MKLFVVKRGSRGNPSLVEHASVNCHIEVKLFRYHLDGVLIPGPA